jgi:inhibitor of cysteine peptidase
MTKMKRKLILMGLAVILTLTAVSVTACSNPEPGTVTQEVPIDTFMNESDIVGQVEVPVGDTLVLKLGSNVTTGFAWNEEAEISDTSVLKQTGHEYISPETDLVGAAGQEVWTFKALKKGTVTVSVEYSRPWEGGEKAEWTYELTVTVK